MGRTQKKERCKNVNGKMGLLQTPQKKHSGSPRGEGKQQVLGIMFCLLGETLECWGKKGAARDKSAAHQTSPITS